jgi:hypothetical protein
MTHADETVIDTSSAGSSNPAAAASGGAAAAGKVHVTHITSHTTTEEKVGLYLIYFLMSFTILLIPFTLKKVIERWKKANSDIQVEEMV